VHFTKPPEASSDEDFDDDLGGPMTFASVYFFSRFVPILHLMSAKNW
jgi:hypothetical protein